MTCACLDFDARSPLARLYLGFPALRYQQQGYAVLPAGRGVKQPHRMLGDRGGVHWATTDPAMPPWAWGQDPAANIAVATGWRSRLVVIDLDVKAGADGPSEWGRFLGSNRLAMPATLPCWAETPSGGMHIWLRTPAGAAVRGVQGILPAVDVKGDGGYVLAAPSMLMQSAAPRPGGRDGGVVPVPYRWTSGCPCSVPEAPAWLLPWLAAAPAAVASGVTLPGGGPGPDLETLASTGIPKGHRNSELYRLACSRFRARGTSDLAGVLDDLRRVLHASDRSGFGDEELLTIARSAQAFVAGSVDTERRRQDEIREKVGWLFGRPSRSTRAATGAAPGAAR